MKVMTAPEIGKALEAMSKAISDVNVVGGNLAREDLQAGIAVAGPMETPLRNRLNRIQGEGTAHAFYRMEPNADRSNGFFYGTTPGNGVFPKGGLPIDAQENYRQVSTPYSNLGDVARVTFQDRAQGRSFTDLYTQRKRVKALNTAMMEEFFIINGDSSSVQPGGGYIFDGIIKQVKDHGGQQTTPTDGKLTLGLVAVNQEQIVEAGGMPRVCIMDYLGGAILTRQVNQIYQIHQVGGAGLTDIGGGVSVREWDFGFGPVPWLKSRYLIPAVGGSEAGDHFFINLDDQSVDTQNDGNVIQMVDVDPLHSVDLAIVSTAWSSVIYETTALMISVPQFQGLIHGLTYSGQSAATG